jgi:hypothetical protein
LAQTRVLSAWAAERSDALAWQGSPRIEATWRFR